jgi:xylulokinase
MGRAALVGIDVGTTGVRAAVVDERGNAIARASEACVPSSASSASSGRAEADAEMWWRAVCAVLGKLDAQAPLAGVDAVGVTGQAPSAVLIDEAGTALRPAILWLDVRADAQARAIDAALGPGGAEAIGGNRMHAYYLGPKLAWLRDHDPDVLDRAFLVLQPHAFVVRRLTGEAACDPSTAMLSAPLFDARAGAWSEAGARAVGLPMRLLPRVARAHDVIGGVTRAAAAATGLREKTPVVAGGGDFASSALGAGVIDEGEACLMLGTAGNLLMPMQTARFDARLINSHHVGCDRWLALGGTLCGAALDWFRGACAPGVAWETLEAEAAAVDVREMGRLCLLPYFQGERTPIWDERARGLVFGVDRTHTRGHLYRALLEGIALGFRHSLVVAQEGGASFGEVAAANGAGRSALLRQILADSLGVPVTWRDGGAGDRAAGGTLAGAALVAGIGAGNLAGPEVARAWLGPGVRHEPDPRGKDRLSALFDRRQALFAAVQNAEASLESSPSESST